MAAETNAERLEQISNDAEFILDGFTDELECVELSPNDYSFLFKQAERAQELASENFEIREGYQERSKRAQELENMCNTSLHIQRMLRKENASLREALKKIAASGLDCFENECTYIARKALAGETNGQHQA